MRGARRGAHKSVYFKWEVKNLTYALNNSAAALGAGQNLQGNAVLQFPPIGLQFILSSHLRLLKKKFDKFKRHIGQILIVQASVEVMVVQNLQTT